MSGVIYDSAMISQARSWMPSADNTGLTRTLVGIPTFKNHALTWAVIKDCLREPVRAVVIDNSGDYEAIADEIVTRPDRNLGWLRSSNLVMKSALSGGVWDRIVLLNNDVRLSASFFSGIVWAERESDASIVGASYDDSWAIHRPEQLTDGQQLNAHEYTPEPRNIPTEACDGTALSIRCDALERIGIFDEGRFGKYGWGATVDLCYRARGVGLKIVVTRAAYVHHIGGGHQTAKEVFGDHYVELASDEARSGLGEKWGAPWIRNRLEAKFGNSIPVSEMDSLGRLISSKFAGIEESGADRDAYVHALDTLLDSLTKRYGSHIPVDRAYKIMERLESGRGLSSDEP
jgi:hypothetical protein